MAGCISAELPRWDTPRSSAAGSYPSLCPLCPLWLNKSSLAKDFEREDKGLRRARRRRRQVRGST